MSFSSTNTLDVSSRSFQAGTAVTLGSAFPSASSGFPTSIAHSTPSPVMVIGGPFGTSSSTAGDSFPGWGTYLDLYSTLNTSLGILLIGLLIAAISFGVVCTKAFGYLRGSKSDMFFTKALVAVLVGLNITQMAFTAHAVYTSVVVDFGQLNALLDNEWSIMIQIGFMTLIASIVQCFFIYRLYRARHNLTLSLAALLLVTLQFALSIVSVVQMFQQGYVTVMLYEDGDSIAFMATTFGISGAVDVTLAILGYLWLQRPYMFRLRGRSTTMDESEYWLVKSLFICGILSIYNTIGVSIMDLNLSWLAVTFVLGNLYTLSVILNVSEERLLKVSPTVMSLSTAPASEVGSTRHASTATLTNNTTFWDDVIKAQMMQPLGPPEMAVTKGEDKDTYLLGYHVTSGTYAV